MKGLGLLFSVSKCSNILNAEDCVWKYGPSYIVEATECESKGFELHLLISEEPLNGFDSSHLLPVLLCVPVFLYAT